MNYAQARRLDDGTGWHFTIRRDDLIFAAPCCMDHGPHATQTEAEACFNAWRRRQPVDLTVEWGNYQECEIEGCGELTKSCAAIPDLPGPRFITLCLEHLDEGLARSLLPDVTSMSYS